MRKAIEKHTYQDWMEMVEEIKLAVELSYPMSLFQATVDMCNTTGISYGATEYERREAISNAVFGTGYHVDRNNKVAHLSDLISLREISLGEAADRPCVKFRVHVKLEEGREYLSHESLEWLDANCDVVSVNRHLETNVAPIIEACRALDAYATDVEAEVYRQLSRAVKGLMLRKRVSVLVIRASDAISRVTFDIYSDQKLGNACVGARLSADSKVVAFEASALNAICHLAKAVAVDQAVVATFVRCSLEQALDAFEYWNFGEQRDTQGGDGEPE